MKDVIYIGHTGGLEANKVPDVCVLQTYMSVYCGENKTKSLFRFNKRWRNYFRVKG